MRGCGAGTVHSFERTKMELMDYRVHLTGSAVRDASGPRTGESGNGIVQIPRGRVQDVSDQKTFGDGRVRLRF